MSSASENAEVFYLDDMEDQILITEMLLRRQKLSLNAKFFLDEVDMLDDLAERCQASKTLPSLIVTDLNMPGKGGVHLVGKLRSDASYRDITIGVCTGSESPADAEASMAAGADFFVIKPFNRDRLLHICETTGRFQLIQRDDGKEWLRQTNA